MTVWIGINQTYFEIMCWVFFVDFHSDICLVTLVCLVYKTVVHEENTVWLLSITIIDLFPSHDVLCCHNEKPSILLTVSPPCMLINVPMIEHISNGNQTWSLFTIYIDSKNSAHCRYSSDFEISERKLLEVRNSLQDKVVVSFNTSRLL